MSKIESGFFNPVDTIFPIKFIKTKKTFDTFISRISGRIGYVSLSVSVLI